MDHQISEAELIPKREARLRFRDQILLRWDYRCAYCAEHLGRSATLDHVVPKAKGGSTEARNLVPACLDCNAHKQHHDWRAWFEAQAFYCAVRAQMIHEWVSQRPGGI